MKYPKTSFRPERAGDVRHSLADITAAKKIVGYEPSHDIRLGLEEACNWYLDNHKKI
jgi:UDP-N-acetylglucosamine 4-epimerase